VVLEAGTLTEADLQQVRDEVRDAIRDAVRTGQSGPPSSADLLGAVYAPSEVDHRSLAGEREDVKIRAEGTGPVAAAAGTREEAEAP
jgi:TPP-dependent pyruvate/acetoin dehydrogenase alpha subunit